MPAMMIAIKRLSMLMGFSAFAIKLSRRPRLAGVGNRFGDQPVPGLRRMVVAHVGAVDVRIQQSRCRKSCRRMPSWKQSASKAGKTSATTAP